MLCDGTFASLFNIKNNKQDEHDLGPFRSYRLESRGFEWRDIAN